MFFQTTIRTEHHTENQRYENDHDKLHDLTFIPGGGATRMVKWQLNFE